MPMFYTEDDMTDLRRERDGLADLLIRIGATARGAKGWEWDPNVASGTKDIRVERDKARDEAHLLQHHLLQARAQRDSAQAALFRAGWAKVGTTADKEGEWVPQTTTASAEHAARPVDPGPGRLTIELPVWERRAEAERLLLEMGWTITTDRQSYTPPVCWLPPTLVHVLEKVAAADSDACLGYTLTPGDVRYIAMGVGAIRSARPNKVFEHVAWVRADLVGALRDLSTQNTPWATVAQTETIRRAVTLFDLLEAAGDRAGPPAELRVDTSDIPEAGAEWFAKAAWREGRMYDAFSTDRAADLPTPAKINARTIPFPVLDAIALLAAIDTRAAPFAGGTRAAEAVGELEQGVESWLDRKAGA